MDILRQRDVAHPVSPLDEHIDISDSDCFSQSAADDHHRTRSVMTLNRCRRQCGRIHPGSISNLCSATLGAGALSLPYAISLTGIVFGVLLLIVSAYLTVVSIDVIIEACVRTQLFKYEDVSVRLVGRGAGRVLEASLLVFCFGTAVAYIVAMGDILDQGLRSIPYLWASGTDGEEAGWGFIAMYSRERIMVLFWAMVMFPLSLQRHVEALERFSSLGVLSIIFLMLAAAIHSITHGDVIGKGDESQETHTTDISSMLWPKSFWDVAKAFPIVIFAFSCQVNVCEIFEELRPDDTTNATNNVIPHLKSKQRIMARITRNGIALCVSLYTCIGLFGFLDFSHDTVDNILNNYCTQYTHDSLMIAASAFVAVAVVVAFPFNILPARVTLKLILERMKRRRRCGRCFRFFSGVTCDNCVCYWTGLERRHHQENSVTSMEVDDASVSSPANQHNNNQATVDALPGVTDPLLGNDDMFGDRPNIVPHMSLEGLPIEEVYSTDSSPLEHFLLTLLLSGSALIVALLIPGISVIFGLMGGTAASIISFILPGMFLMEADADVTNEENGGSTRRRKLLPLFLVWGGTLIGILSTGITIYDMFSPNDNASVDTCGNSDYGSTTLDQIE
eukprot:CAMPEP_0172305590 /NCGR_PEP_ID=MMETSP1058-20130122/6842_1 /TAXON_ID=83371 /ORGANISM="Detonula confervacea, Strain CCMP 353" /LENGTH=618 /DNA_ID=CAMNT_0013017227 /DNA_START=34 /DNA_END=1890 /DNA_ORIENTATION=+